MADLLIKHLEEKAKDHSALGRLVHQWGFDEQLIPKALQTIGSLFPHYSNHDESHSKQILINIERLLGPENISKLTASDTWLLLESAYWHDIGMVVPQQDIKDAFDDLDFKRYLTSIKNSPNHELNKFCLSFDPKNINKCFSGASTPLDAMEKLQQLMAEWFRRQHPRRANDIINEPWKSVGLSSPRTELIPSRLFKLLGRVCHMHGLPFNEIIGANGLPFREAGLAQEDCHPRFVACLLRMGDLLDIDDNRFCPVMQRIAGESRPALTRAHEDKHAGIRHLRVDRERIEISAECESIDGYLETYKWFEWLKQEIQNQMAHWQDIVPSREFGLLPTLGTIQVSLSGNQQLLAEGKKPQFSVDGEQAASLLKGPNLYESNYACIRELLQNAVDATLLGLWVTQKIDNNNILGPLSEAASEILRQTPICVNLVENIDTQTPEDKTSWTLTIIDQGTGISINDVGHMLNIGGSSKNTFRQEKISEMPEWLKPSGTFGIGFQSIFMICDSVKLTTKDMFSNEFTEITLHDLMGPSEGLVTIKALENDVSIPFGTKLEASFLLDKKSSSWSIGLGGESMAKNLVSNYDPILDDAFPFEATKLVDQIQEFSKYSMIPLKGYFESGSVRFNFEENFPPPQNDFRFVEVDDHQLRVSYSPSESLTYHSMYEVTYRGQPFEKNLQFSRFLNIRIDLLSGKAGSWLTFNRDKLLGSARTQLLKLTRAAVKTVIQQDLENPSFSSKLSEKQNMILSFYLGLMSLEDESWDDIYRKLNNYWHNLPFGIDEKITYKALSKKSKWIISEAVDQSLYSHLSQGEAPPEENDCDILLNNSQHLAESVKTMYVHEWLTQAGHSVAAIESSHYETPKKQLRLCFSKKPQDLYNSNSLATAIIKAVGAVHFNARFLLSVNEDVWEILHLKDHNNILGTMYLFSIQRPNQPFVLLPFLFLFMPNNESDAKVRITDDELDQLSHWIIPYLKNAATAEQVKCEYQKLIAYIDHKIMEPSPFKEEWWKNRNLDTTG